MNNDTGVACLSLIARYHQLATDPAQLSNRRNFRN
ncbi:MAG: cysteine peptidase family C39 domain-containing protein [Exilibacterium sp.]